MIIYNKDNIKAELVGQNVVISYNSGLVKLTAVLALEMVLTAVKAQIPGTIDNFFIDLFLRSLKK